jgi:hypothetical protein|tara:strand:+ start:588 stop:827 length:240 start_codon:yes stop_codon:yes gene_type:complete
MNKSELKGFDTYEELKVAEYLVEDSDVFYWIESLMKEYSFNVIANIVGGVNLRTKEDNILVTAEILRKLLNSNYSKVFI